MAKTILVCGFGVGISQAVAERFGREGFSVAAVARDAGRLDTGVKALAAKGIQAAAFSADLGDPTAARAVVARVREAMGPITAIHWNAYATQAGDLLTADTAAIRGALDISTTSLVAVVQAALPDLRATDGAAILVTNGGFGRIDPQADAISIQFGAMGVALSNAAKAKLVGLLSEKLKSDRIYVGEVTVNGIVKGTAWDQGGATIEASAIAERFWSLYKNRTDSRASIS